MASPWPNPQPVPPLTHIPDDTAKELTKSRYDKQLEWTLEVLKRDRDTNARTDEHYLKVMEALYSAYLDVGEGVLADTTDRAKQLITAASAIATVYGAILALLYNAQNAGSNAKLLPERGIWTAVFLGLAIVLALVKLAFITQPPESGSTQVLDGELRNDARNQVFQFVAWTRDATLRRRWALHAAVVSLAVGLALFPLPFLSLSDAQGRVLAAVGLLTVIAIPIGVHAWESRS